MEHEVCTIFGALFKKLQYKITNTKLGTTLNIYRDKKSQQITNLRKLIVTKNSKIQEETNYFY